MSLPAIINECRLKMQDEDGLSCETGTPDGLSFANDHTIRGNRWGPCTAYRLGFPGTADIVRVYQSKDSIPHHLFAWALPPVGTPVWQIKGRDLKVVRTHIVKGHYTNANGIVLTQLIPAGPFGTEMQPGDSGSGVWFVEGGKAKQLGVVNQGGYCHTGFWTKPFPSIPAVTFTRGAQETLVEMNRTQLVTPQNSAWYYLEQPQTPTPVTPPPVFQTESEQIMARLAAAEALNSRLAADLSASAAKLASLRAAWATLQKGLE